MCRVIILMLSLSPCLLNAQRATVKTNMLWAGYYCTINISNRWAVNTDIQFRTREWTAEVSQGLIRSGLTYRISDHFSATAGFAVFQNAQYVGDDPIMKNEFRPWQELAYQVNLKRIKFNHRLRNEQRFLQQLKDGKEVNEYERISRLRYKVDGQLPLKKHLNLVLANEILVHPGYIGDKRFFDQNRASVALNLKVSKPVSLQMQYMKIYQNRSNATILEDQNVFRFLVYHQINLKK